MVAAAALPGARSSSGGLSAPPAPPEGEGRVRPPRPPETGAHLLLPLAACAGHLRAKERVGVSAGGRHQGPNRSPALHLPALLLDPAATPALLPHPATGCAVGCGGGPRSSPRSWSHSCCLEPPELPGACQETQNSSGISSEKRGSNVYKWDFAKASHFLGASVRRGVGNRRERAGAGVVRSSSVHVSPSSRLA